MTEITVSDCLADIVARLQDEFALTPVIAGEIEFYLPTLPDELLRASLPVPLEAEKGAGQWEIALPPHTQVANAIEELASCQALLKFHGADFRAKPFADQPGSGLHIHVHLMNDAGDNVFFKRDELISDTLNHSLGGLLATLHDAMPIFAPSEISYARFAPGTNAPTTLSWGANNRTVAIRLPDIGAPFRHIEHRVAGADADAEACIAAILAGMHYGLTHRIQPPPQIYGDASRAQYALPPLPKSLAEAQAGAKGLLNDYGLVP